jgi:hypothetical protein
MKCRKEIYGWQAMVVAFYIGFFYFSKLTFAALKLKAQC